MKHLAILITTLCIGSISLNADSQTYGPELDEEIVTLYVPPTRADSPYIATASALYHYDKSKRSWELLYSPPWKGSQILGISGYAKSSQMIYLVHSHGIAASRDAGKSWTESIPSGFGPSAGDLVSIQVHPADRKQALVVFENACWQTNDYGVSFESFLEGNSFVGAAFSPSESGDGQTRIFVSSQHIHIDGENGFVSIDPPQNKVLTRVTAHPSKPFVYIHCADGTLLVFNTTEQRAAVVGGAIATQVSTIFSSESSLWSHEGGQVSITHFQPGQNPQNFAVHAFPSSDILMGTHPRQPDSLYVADGRQLHLLSEGFKNLPSQILAPLNQRSFAPLKRSIKNLQQSEVESQLPGNTSLAAMIAAEPSLTSTIATAVTYNLHNPEKLAEWNRKARTRHWMPELRIAGYAREGTLNVTRLDTYTDRFGIEQTEDLRLSDQLKTYNTAAVFFEWNLQELIYDEEQVDVVRERRYQADYRRKLATEITSIYYDRIELIAAYKGISKSGKAKSLSPEQIYLGIRELTDLLNTICGESLFSHSHI